MNKLTEIVIALANELRAPVHLKELALERYEICSSCPYNKKDLLEIEWCRKCHCRIKSKIFSPKGSDACPMQKWIN